MFALIHVFLDNAVYHHAKLVRVVRLAHHEGLARPGCRIKFAFYSSVLPALEPYRTVTGPHAQTRRPNKCYATCGQFADVTLDFLCGKVPKNWENFRDSVTDNFRVIRPKEYGL